MTPGWRRATALSVSTVYESPPLVTSMSEASKPSFPATASFVIASRSDAGASDCVPLWGGVLVGMKRTRSSLSVSRTLSATMR